MRELLSDEKAIQYTIPGIGYSSPEGIHVNGNLHINPDSPLLDQYIKTNYYKVNGNFELISNSITSLEGCPKEVAGDCYIRLVNGTKISLFEGCPQKVEKVFKFFDKYNEYHSLEGICRSAHTYRLWADGLTSYHNVHKYIDSFSLFEMTEHVTECLLGFVLVKTPGSLIRSYRDDPLDRAIAIVDKYTNEYHEVLECQEELIENGLKQFAKL